MNRLMVTVFANESAADAGLNLLRTAHAAGDIMLYATGVLARDAKGVGQRQEVHGPRPYGYGHGSGRLTQAWSLTKEALAV